MKIVGGCACGAISYSSSAEPKFTLMCQCRQCQRITGAGHSAQFFVDAGDTIITGPLKFHELAADSGNTVKSAFCENCGNPIYKITTMMPDVFGFHAATLDDPSQFESQMVVNSGTGQPWDCIDPEVPRKG